MAPLFLLPVNEQSVSCLGVGTLTLPSEAQGDGGGGGLGMERGGRALTTSWPGASCLK